MTINRAALLASALLLAGFLCKPIHADIVRGSGASMGMTVQVVTHGDGRFNVKTTGARFSFKENVLSVAQGLSLLRPVAQLHLPGAGGLEMLTRQPDHVAFRGRAYKVTIHGDGTCIIQPDSPAIIAIQGNFKPDYVGRYHAELLLIDEHGGIALYSDRNSALHPMAVAHTDTDSWRATYPLAQDERLMLVAFPGRSFDWQKSFESNILFTQASHGEPYGLMPPNGLILKWSQYFNVLVLWHKGLYKASGQGDTYAGPYEVANQSELIRLVQMAHMNGMKVALYTSFYYFHQKFQCQERYFEQLQKLKDQFDIDGVYIDGLLSGLHGHDRDQVFVNWEMIRRLRALFGGKGVIVYHGTAFGHPVATMPHVDAYCDATLNGENVPFQSVTDPYVRYHVRKYGISNTIALWKPGPHPPHISDTEMIDAILLMNGRERFWAGVTAEAPTPRRRNIWIEHIDYRYRYYVEQLLALKRSRTLTKADPPCQRPVPTP